MPVLSLEDFQTRHEDNYHMMVFVLPDGSYYTTRNGLVPEANLSDREHFITATSGIAAVGDIVISRSTGYEQVNVFCPIYGSDVEEVGELAGAVKTRRIHSVVSRISSSIDGGTGLLLDSQRDPILDPERDAGMPVTEINIDYHNLTDTEIPLHISSPNLDGLVRVEDGYLVYRYLTTADWILTLSISSSNFSPEILGLNVISVILCLTLVLVLVISHQWLKGQKVANIRRIENEHILKINANLSASLEQRTAEIKLSEARAKAHTQDLMYKQELERNRQYERILETIHTEMGGPLCTIIASVKTWRDIYLEQGREIPEFVKDLMLCAAELGQLQFTLEYLNCRTSPQQHRHPSQTYKSVCKQLLSEYSVPTCLEIINLPHEAQDGLDCLMIKNALKPLLDNATSYAAPHPCNKLNCDDGKIILEVEPIGGEILFRVLDRGVGIPENEISKIKEPFVRGSNFPIDGGGPKRMGMGLTVAEQYANLLGGTIHLRNRDEGGLEATLSIPSAVRIASSEEGHPSVVSPVAELP